MQYLVIPLFFMVIVAFIGGITIGYYAHPYEECQRRGITPDDVGECVWLLKNQPALR